MQNIIKVNDSTIDVKKIMKDISAKAKTINSKDIAADVNLVANMDLTDDEISPLIISYLKKPTSKKSGFISRISNKIISKIYFVVWNTLGDMLTQQQHINKQLVNTVRNLEKKIDRLSSNGGAVSSNRSLDDLFDYVKFEDLMRGDVKIISDKQSDYIRFIDRSKMVLDIGCGRGEFLKILKNEGINAEGIDLNREMVDVCLQQGLDVRYGNAIDYLSTSNNEYGAIFAAQVIEHLEYPDIIDLVKTSYEHLSNKGYLILETPNPTTLASYVGGFYSDPTHIHFVHPLTLKFICHEAGFSKVEFIYSSLQDNRLKVPENADEITKYNIEKLNEVIFGYLDYAIIAYKDENLSTHTDTN